MKRAGFTMIELVFVIVILGILAAVAVPRLSQTKAQATTAANDADEQTCVKEARLNYFQNGALANVAAYQALPGCATLATAFADPTLTVNGTAYPLN